MRIIKRIAFIFIIVLCVLAFIAFAAWINRDSIEYYFSHEFDQNWHFDYFSPIHVFKGKEIVAHVRFVELENNISPKRRSEYVFEVIDWLKGGNGEKKISAYSSKMKGKAWGELELTSNGNYEEGKEYVVVLYSDGGIYKISSYIFCPLDNFQDNAKFDYLDLYQLLVRNDEMPPDVTRSELIEFIRYLSNKHYTTREEYLEEYRKQLQDPLTLYPFADDGSELAYVRLLEKKENPDDENRYYEYSFQVLRWLRDGWKEGYITAYLEKNYGDDYTRKVFKEYEGVDCHDYFVEKEFIVKLKYVDEEYRICYELFCEIYEVSQNDIRCVGYSNFVSITEILNKQDTVGIPPKCTSSEEMIEKINELCSQPVPST